MGGSPPNKESVMKYEVQYNSVFFSKWIPLFMLSDGTGKKYDSYTEAMRAFANHLNAMLDSDEGDDVSLEDYRIVEVSHELHV
jgi:hypothetical protein